MKPALKEVNHHLYHFVGVVRVEGANPNMYGDCTDLCGDCSGLRGNCSGLWGDLSACELTDEDRRAGVNIRDLIGGDQ